jgi:restriction endonuclease S subunit
MEILNNTYLKFIDSKHFLSWDVKSFFLSQWIFKENIPFVFFWEFLSKYETTKIHIEDNKIYKILWVRTYWNGVFINREVKWNTLNMRTYQLADENTLFWCKVDTKNGWFWIVKKEHEWWLWSSNMFFAKIDINKINPEYLQLLFKSPQIHSYMDQFVTWTTNRKYIKPDQLLSEIKIPLPNLSEQNRIVEEYNKKIQDSINAEIKAWKLEKEIESYLTEELGIEVREKEEKKVWLNFIDFKNLIIWSFW